jgi:hypothetical protein
MKLTKSKLKQLIKEEIQTLSEDEDVSLEQQIKQTVSVIADDLYQQLIVNDPTSDRSVSEKEVKDYIKEELLPIIAPIYEKMTAAVVLAQEEAGRQHWGPSA